MIGLRNPRVRSSFRGRHPRRKSIPSRGYQLLIMAHRVDLTGPVLSRLTKDKRTVSAIGKTDVNDPNGCLAPSIDPTSRYRDN